MIDKPTSDLPFYEIRIKGHLDAQWMTWFDGLTITLEENGDTLLSGPVADQAALHGLLKKVRDLGMPLVSVVQINRFEKGKRMDISATPVKKIEMKKFFQFSSRVIVAHIVTYIGVGVLAFTFLTREFFNPNGIAAQIMRTPDQHELWRHVTIWMLPFQILRGFLIATVLFPFLSCLRSWPYWKRVVTIGGLYIVLGQWASTVAGSGTIEGWLILKPEFTTFPVVVKAMIEGFIQGLALSAWISKSINHSKGEK